MYNRTLLLTTSPPLYRVSAQVRSLGAQLFLNPPHNGAHAPAFEPPQRIHDCMRTPRALSLHRSRISRSRRLAPSLSYTKHLFTVTDHGCCTQTPVSDILALPMQFMPPQSRHLPLQPPVTKFCTSPPSPCRNSPSCAFHTNCTCLGHPLSTVPGPPSASFSAIRPCPLPFGNAAPFYTRGKHLWYPL